MRKIMLVFCILCLCLVGCNNINKNVTTTETAPQKMYFDNGMQKFPSYDWGAEDGKALAMISANTGGSDIDKQKAILYALDRVWYYDNISLSEWAYRNYELYNQPTKHDYELVNMIIFGEWAE